MSEIEKEILSLLKDSSDGVQVEEIAKKFPATTVVNGLDLALEAGNPKTVNTVLLGTLSKKLEVDYQLWIDALKKMVPPKLLDINLKAFELGRNAS